MNNTATHSTTTNTRKLCPAATRLSTAPLRAPRLTISPEPPGMLEKNAVARSSPLRRINHTLSPLEIVVVNTRAGSRYGNPDYVSAGAGMGYEATMYLLERGVRLTGTDAWSWDAPFVHTAQKYGASHDASLIWEGHKAGRDIGYCHLEKLHNLEALPPTGFFISCFPHKIRGASAGWTRAVAIFDDALMASR